MVVVENNGRMLWHRFSTRRRLARWLLWFFSLTVILIFWRIGTQDQNWDLMRGVVWQRIWGHEVPVPRVLAVIGDLADRSWPPDFSYLPKLAKPIWDTINIATLGTLMAIVMAIPIALLAARNTTPHPLIRSLAIFVIVASRSINSLIWGLLFVAIVGPGVLAGVLAIAMRSIGFIAKLLYESIDEVDQTAVDAIRSTGASDAQVISHGIAPQVTVALIGINIFRWEINIRESTILGYVGAGGIGLQLKSMVDTLYWDRVSVILIVILATVLVSEYVSSSIRRRVA